jgi:hypothetical protein
MSTKVTEVLAGDGVERVATCGEEHLFTLDEAVRPDAALERCRRRRDPGDPAVPVERVILDVMFGLVTTPFRRQTVVSTSSE